MIQFRRLLLEASHNLNVWLYYTCLITFYICVRSWRNLFPGDLCEFLFDFVMFAFSMILHFFPLFFDVLHTNRLSSKLDIVIWLWSRMKNLKSFLHYWVLCKFKTFPSWRYARSGDLTFVHLQLYIVCGCNLSSTPGSPTEDLTMVLELFSIFFFFWQKFQVSCLL